MNKIVKYSLLSFLFFATAFSSNAQLNILSKSSEVGRIETEVSFGAPYHLKDGKPGVECILQIRENVAKRPWSYGMLLGIYAPQAMYTATYEHPVLDSDGKIISVKEERREVRGYGGFLSGIVGEYDFARGSDFNPFLNSSAGFCWSTNPTVRPYLRLNVGAELFSHLRFSTSITLMSSRGSAVSIDLSAVFGGSPKE